jgi:hypothetical protein
MALDPVAAWIASQGTATPTPLNARYFVKTLSMPSAASSMLHTHHMQHALASIGTFTAASFVLSNLFELWTMFLEAVRPSDMRCVKMKIVRSRASEFVSQCVSSASETEDHSHAAASNEW